MTKIFILSGKARSGKDTSAKVIQNYYNEKGLKTTNLSYAFYIKSYVKKITNWDGTEKNKPRELLQTLGTDIIRKTVTPDFFTRRLTEDIIIYSHYFDVITISDARFIDEIEEIKKHFDNVYSLRILRTNVINELTDQQKHHLSETALDNYNNYDYIVHNDKSLLTLKKQIEKILEMIK